MRQVDVYCEEYDIKGTTSLSPDYKQLIQEGDEFRVKVYQNIKSKKYYIEFNENDLLIKTQIKEKV